MPSKPVLGASTAKLLLSVLGPAAGSQRSWVWQVSVTAALRPVTYISILWICI